MRGGPPEAIPAGQGEAADAGRCRSSGSASRPYNYCIATWELVAVSRQAPSFRVDRVEVKAAPTAPNGYRLQTSDELIEPRYTVVCAGSWIPAILESLGLSHPLVINRSGLLVLPHADSMSAPLLADRSRDLSFVRHISIPPHGRLVVGDKGRASVQPKDG